MGPVGSAGSSQLELDFSRAREEVRPPADERIEDHARRIAGFLSIAMPQSVDVVFHDNRTTMISFGHAQGRIVVRLHRMFRHAGPEELTALARYLKRRDRSASRALDAFIAGHRDEVDQKPRRRAPRGISAGAVHDLAPILERIRLRYFGGFGDVAICWSRERAPSSRRARRTRTRSRALATYGFEDRTIRVSKVLDSARVPEFVLEWVVYHEMLHHVLPAETSTGRRRFHTRRFRALERAFERYDEARDWEKANLDWLLG